MIIKTNNNEELGIYIEKLFCKINKIKFNTKRKKFLVLSRNNNRTLIKEIKNISKIFNIKIIKHNGNNHKSDFILKDNKTLSLKTCKSTNLLCPQIIGQTTLKRLSLYFNKKFIDYNCFKLFISKNLRYAIHEYLKNLFICNNILIINFKTKDVHYISNDNSLTFNTLSYSIKKIWNNSTTIYINEKIPLAQVQIYKKIIKIRFNYFNLLKNNIINNIKINTSFLDNNYFFK